MKTFEQLFAADGNEYLEEAFKLIEKALDGLPLDPGVHGHKYYSVTKNKKSIVIHFAGSERYCKTISGFHRDNMNKKLLIYGIQCTRQAIEGDPEKRHAIDVTITKSKD